MDVELEWEIQVEVDIYLLVYGDVLCVASMLIYIDTATDIYGKRNGDGMGMDTEAVNIMYQEVQMYQL